jgi:hypothetical protein
MKKIICLLCLVVQGAFGTDYITRIGGSVGGAPPDYSSSPRRRAALSEQERVWTSQSGKTVTGQFVRLDSPQINPVVVIQSDTNTIQVRLAYLSSSDKKYVLDIKGQPDYQEVKSGKGHPDYGHASGFAPMEVRQWQPPCTNIVTFPIQAISEGRNNDYRSFGAFVYDMADVNRHVINYCAYIDCLRSNGWNGAEAEYEAIKKYNGWCGLKLYGDVVQILEEGILCNMRTSILHDDAESHLILLKNHPTVGLVDGDALRGVNALPQGTFRYASVGGFVKTIRVYDCGVKVHPSESNPITVIPLPGSGKDGNLNIGL